MGSGRVLRSWLYHANPRKLVETHNTLHTSTTHTRSPPACNPTSPARPHVPVAKPYGTPTTRTTERPRRSPSSRPSTQVPPASTSTTTPSKHTHPPTRQHRVPRPQPKSPALYQQRKPHTNTAHQRDPSKTQHHSTSNNTHPRANTACHPSKILQPLLQARP